MLQCAMDWLPERRWKASLRLGRSLPRSLKKSASRTCCISDRRRSFMNGRERLALAMQRREPDRTPVMCQLSLGHYFLNAGLPPHQIWFTSEGFAEALVGLQRRYRFDGILINIPGRPANILDDVVSVQPTDEGERLTWRTGDVTLVPWDDSPHHFSSDGTQPQRADFETLDPERLDKLDEWTGYTWNIYHTPYLAEKSEPGPLCETPDYFFRTIDLVKAQVGDAVSIHGEVFSPFTHYMELLGYEQALIGLATDCGKVHALLDRLTEASVAWARAQARHGVDAVLISSALRADRSSRARCTANLSCRTSAA